MQPLSKFIIHLLEMNMLGFNRKIILIFWVFLMALGCTPTPDSEGVKHTITIVPAESEAFPPIFRGYEGYVPKSALEFPDFRPAFPLPAERLMGKADGHSPMDKNPEYYAITIPTKTIEPNVTGMVEWEAMQILLLTISGDALPAQVDEGLAQMIYSASYEAGVDSYLIYDSQNHKNTIVNILNGMGMTNSAFSKVHWVQIPYETIWAIDYGPFPVKNPSNDIAFIDFRYYDGRPIDDAIPTRFGHETLDIDTFRMPLGFEGGNLQMDSHGTCYTTQGVLWFNQNYSEQEIKQLLSDYVGCTQTVIISPLEDEGTTHIDMFFKLVDDNTIILGQYTSEQDPGNKQALDNNAQILSQVMLPDGTSPTVIRLPMPSNRGCVDQDYWALEAFCDDSSDCPNGYTCVNRAVWRTYINSTFVHGPTGKVNLWPTYDGEEHFEDQALEIWQEAMPEWNHQKVPSDRIISWGGAMHCISRTVPAGNLTRWVQPGSCSGDSCSPATNTGYDGSCDVTTGCSGPKWECEFNLCESDPCQGITYQGCCTDEGNLRFCENLQIEEWDCGNQGCGWVNQGYYNCGGSAQPPMEFPIDCPSACIPDCAGKSCGPDGCGRTCGSCGVGEVCQSSTCVPAAVGCNGVTPEGCCDGAIVKYCQDDSLVERNCGTPDNCGWDDQANHYDCDQTGSGPSEFPLSCGGGPGSCEGTPTTGACDGNTLQVCTDDGVLFEQQCEECCGWIEAAGYFDCLTGVACESAGDNGTGPADAGSGSGSGSSSGCSATPSGSSQPASPLFLLLFLLVLQRMRREKSPAFRRLT